MSKGSSFNLGIQGARITIFAWISFIASFSGALGMEKMQGEELSSIDAGAGLSMDFGLLTKIDGDMKYSPDMGGYIEMNGLNIGNQDIFDMDPLNDGPWDLNGSLGGDVFSVTVPEHYEYYQSSAPYSPGIPSLSVKHQKIPQSQRSLANINVSSIKDMNLDVDDILFKGNNGPGVLNMGSLTVRDLDIQNISGYVTGENGLRAALSAQIHIASLGIGPTDVNGSGGLVFQGVHLAEKIYNTSMNPNGIPSGYKLGSDLPGYGKFCTGYDVYGLTYIDSKYEYEFDRTDNLYQLTDLGNGVIRVKQWSGDDEDSSFTVTNTTLRTSDWACQGNISIGDLVKNYAGYVTASNTDSENRERPFNMENNLIPGTVKPFHAPVKLDVFTAADGTTKVAMVLNAAASVRIENMKFGDRNSGPVAIDGARINFLSLRLQTSPDMSTLH